MLKISVSAAAIVLAVGCTAVQAQDAGGPAPVGKRFFTKTDGSLCPTPEIFCGRNLSENTSFTVLKVVPDPKLDRDPFNGFAFVKTDDGRTGYLFRVG